MKRSNSKSNLLFNFFVSMQGWVYNVLPWLASIPASVLAGCLGDALIAHSVPVGVSRKIIHVSLSLTFVHSWFFFRTLLWSTIIFFHLASFPHYNNTKIIKFGWELFILWVISYGLSFSGFARFPDIRGTINDKLMVYGDRKLVVYGFRRFCGKAHPLRRKTVFAIASIQSD